MMCNQACHYATNCTECRKRAQQGPHYDPKRGTGRTTRAINAALLAAVSGKRVLHVSATDQLAQEARHQSRELLHASGIAPHSISANAICFHNGGWVHFRSMSADLEYRGYRKDGQPELKVWDHYAEEERDRKAKEAERLEDANEIKRLMRKHGWSDVEDMCPGPVNKLVFRT